MAIQRPSQIQLAERQLPLPVYFPSISSVKTALRPHDYLQLLTSLSELNSQFLVSAFDLADMDDAPKVVEQLAGARARGAVILMDSGNYESFWKEAQGDWKQPHFHQIIKVFPCDLAFGFDEQKPPADSTEHLELIIKRWQADQDEAGACQIIPIIHASATELPALCAVVARETGVTMIAVAERKLGDGILERAQAVQAIRAELDGLGRYVALHLLGTGNPISIALYTAMGADSFDGLEWCQTTVDHDTGLLYHLSQADFFAGQTAWGDAGLSFQARTLAHNLEFFADFMRRLREVTHHGSIADFCRLNLPARAYQHCATVAGWSPE